MLLNLLIGGDTSSNIRSSNTNNNNNNINSSTPSVIAAAATTPTVISKMNNNSENFEPTTLPDHIIETSSTTTTTKTIEQPQQQREPTKKYKFKSKTDFIGGGKVNAGDEVDVMSNENELVVETNENSRPGGGLSLSGTAVEPTSVAGLEIGMTIQERMAALKKIGEDSWKRRTPADSQPPAPINIESTQPNIVKQQKEQIQLQLKQMLSTTKTKSLMGASSPSGAVNQRNVLSTLDDNNADTDLVGVGDVNKTAHVTTTTTTTTRDQDLFASKKALIEKRVLFTPPDLAAQHGN